MTAYSTLREANNVRQAEWDTGGNIDLSYAANELAGEVSEALAEAVFQINDPEPLLGTHALANELADVIICVDLIGIRAGTLPVNLAMVAPFDLGVERAQDWVNEMASDLQLVCNTVKKLERERHGMPGSRATKYDLENGLRLIHFNAHAIAACFDINLDPIVASKFNATSEKVGLKTRLVL